VRLNHAVLFLADLERSVALDPKPAGDHETVDYGFVLDPVRG
jgi:hypothetical protein